MASEGRDLPSLLRSDYPLSPENLPRAPDPPPSLDQLPVGSRLGACLPAWRKIQADTWTLDLITRGLSLSFHTPPPLSNAPLIYSQYGDPEKQGILEGLVLEMIEKKVVEPVLQTSSPGFYNRLFLVPKRGGSWRPVIDLSALNRALIIPSFRMETSEQIMSAVRPGEWLTSLDLTDAYFHVPIFPTHRKFLRFVVKGQVYQFIALPFGLSTAPYAFSRLVRSVAAFAHTHRVLVHQYLDDWLLRAHTHSMSNEITAWLLSWLIALGFKVNFKKSDMNPEQQKIFLGIVFDLVRYQARPSQDSIQRCLGVLQMFLTKPLQPALYWQRLIGHLVSLTKIVPLGATMLRPIQRSLSSQWSPVSMTPYHKVAASEEASSALQWWSEEQNLLLGMSLRPFQHQVQMFTDASTQGWGACLNSLSVQGTWGVSESRHINILEMTAVLRACQSFIAHIRDRDLLVLSDNTTVVAYINHQGGSRSNPTSRVAEFLHFFLFNHKVRGRSRHIAGILNTVADQLSRGTSQSSTEWSLHPEIAQMVWDRYHRPLVDLFATHLNNKLDVFVSPFHRGRVWMLMPSLPQNY